MWQVALFLILIFLSAPGDLTEAIVNIAIDIFNFVVKVFLAALDWFFNLIVGIIEGAINWLGDQLRGIPIIGNAIPRLTLPRSDLSHLFAGIGHIDLPNVSPIVQAFAAVSNSPYFVYLGYGALAITWIAYAYIVFKAR